MVDHLYPSVVGLIGDHGIATILLTKLDRDGVIEVEGKVEEDHVESRSWKDDGHDFMKFRLSTGVHEVDGGSLLNILDAV